MQVPSWAALKFTSKTKLISAATTNATLVRAGVAKLGYAVVGNNVGTTAFLKIYDKATAPTVGTDIPVATYMIPGSTTGGSPQVIPLFFPINLGLGFAITGGAADSDTTAVALNQCTLVLTYF
jgi:hypothetical protein